MEPIQVKVQDCPTGLHNGEGDWVLLAPTLSLEGGLAAEADLRAANAVDPTERSEVIQRRWAITFVRYGAKGWNFHDEQNDERPFDVNELLSDYAIARAVADKAADLYTDAVLRPFLKLLGERSPTGRTGATTSQARRRTRKSSASSSPDATADSAQSTP